MMGAVCHDNRPSPTIRRQAGPRHHDAPLWLALQKSLCFSSLSHNYVSLGFTVEGPQILTCHDTSKIWEFTAAIPREHNSFFVFFVPLWFNLCGLIFFLGGLHDGHAASTGRADRGCAGKHRAPARHLRGRLDEYGRLYRNSIVPVSFKVHCNIVSSDWTLSL